MFWFALPLVWVAIRDGKITTRSATHTRKQSPGKFYLIIFAWIFMMGLTVLASAAMIDALFLAKADAA